jgi:trehalose utilization protein
MKTLHHLLRFLVFLAASLPLLSPAAPIHVLVWDEQQPAQKQAYANFLGNEIAAYLKQQAGLEVASARLDDPEQGLPRQALDNCDVLIWWGHLRHKEITSATGLEIVRRIKAGRLALIALHSAHWSTPFVEAMNERAREDALKPLTPEERGQATLIETNRHANFFSVPKYDAPLTPAALYRKFPDGKVQVTLTLPRCVFPAYRSDGKPSQMRSLLPNHPIARGLPAQFTIPQTEMYDEPFHVPPPDEAVFEERWAPGEWFRSGCVWQLGRGKVFYFRPGHETYPVFKEKTCLKVLENAARWLAVKSEPGR